MTLATSEQRDAFLEAVGTSLVLPDRLEPSAQGEVRVEEAP
jgi:hypothetical protein